MTSVINIESGEPYNIYIGKKSEEQDGYFGNPFDTKVAQMLDVPFTREWSIEMYRNHFEIQIQCNPKFKSRILELKGKRLGCFCSPLMCHGNIIADYLNNLDN